MRIMKLVYVLYKIKLLSPLSVFRLVKALLNSGFNLMTLLEVAAKKYTTRVAIIDDEASITYKELLIDSNRFASFLQEKFHIQNGNKVAVLCRNHIPLIKSIFAISRIGADLCLLNTDMGKQRIKELINNQNYDALIYDSEFFPLVQKLSFDGMKIVSNDKVEVIEGKLPRASSGKIILQTGGTTGNAKEAGHKPSLFNYLIPFIALIKKLKLLDYHTAYIGTPIFHGYGIAILLLFIPLGKKCVVSSRFEVAKACDLIHEQEIDFITVVPVMLDRMIQYGVKDLGSLRCIASGGARLHPRLVRKTVKHLGDVLYNLYGTSEAGLTIIATPDSLAYSPLTLGKKISGLKIKIVDKEYQSARSGVVGEIYVKSAWSMRNRKNSWIKTGDMGFQDESGYFFLSGRSDEMIVSGGENVFPSDVEHILLEHPEIQDVAVVGVEDEEFGERLKAFVKTTKLTKQEILEWLKPQIARYQMPKDIVIVSEIPYTPVGKPDKKKLKEDVSL